MKHNQHGEGCASVRKEKDWGIPQNPRAFVHSTSLRVLHVRVVSRDGLASLESAASKGAVSSSSLFLCSLLEMLLVVELGEVVGGTLHA